MRVQVRDDGRITFELLVPIAAPNMEPDVGELAHALEEVRRHLDDLEVRGTTTPARSFRPTGDGFELYMLTVAVPGTTPLRQAKKTWTGRRRKRK